METTIINIDLKNFKEIALKNNTVKIKSFLIDFYSFVNTKIEDNNWEIIKVVTDCILVKCNSSLTICPIPLI